MKYVKKMDILLYSMILCGSNLNISLCCCGTSGKLFLKNCTKFGDRVNFLAKKNLVLEIHDDC